MKMITLEKLRDSLRDWKYEVTVAPRDRRARPRRDRPDGRDRLIPLEPARLLPPSGLGSRLRVNSMNRRRVLAGAAVTATGVFLAASMGGARAGEARAVKEGGTFRVVAAGLLNVIDPALSGTIAEATVLRPVCAGLLAFPDKPLPAGLRVEPDLAEAQPVVSKDGKTYTFRIRKDARFSDGTPVTAGSFVHALERIFDPSMKSSQVVYFDTIVGAREMLEGKTRKLAGVSAVGRTLTIKLTRRVPDFPIALAGPITLCAVPASLPVIPEGARRPSRVRHRTT